MIKQDKIQKVTDLHYILGKHNLLNSSKNMSKQDRKVKNKIDWKKSETDYELKL